MSASAEPCAIRVATVADLAAITAIYATYVREGTASFELEPPDLTEMTRRWRDVSGLGLPFLVAAASGSVVGFAYAGPYRPRPAYRFTVEDSIYVRADCSGQGIGRRLLSDLIDACIRAGSRQMIAVIGDSTNVASIALHRALGFTDTGVLRTVGWKHGLWLDVVLMQRALGGGAASAPENRGPT